MLISLLKTITTTLALITCTWAYSTSYEQNPLPTRQGFMVSHQGIYHFDTNTLRPNWQALNGHKTFAPTIAGDSVLVSSSSGVYAYQLSDGKLLWHHPGGSPFSATVADGLAYISSEDGKLTALDIAQGEPHWSKQLSGWVYPPVVMGDVLITGGSAGLLWGVDRHSGRLLWEQPLGQELFYRPVAVGDNRIALTSFDARLQVLNSRGDTLWQHQFNSLALYPVADSENLYVYELSGDLHAFSLSDGQHRWQQQLNEKPAAAVSVLDDQILAVSSNGTVVQLNRTTGDILHQQQLAVEPITPVFQHNHKRLLIAAQRGKPQPIVLDFSVHSSTSKEINDE
ncbi:MAG: PQQ-like beta-propeller repeat protein [Chromatiales bacterium]|nr:PQQ-like beta-propeller repeat protein [Chromatiales bacterium]